MLDGRKRTAKLLVTLCITALGGSLLVAAPTSADPNSIQEAEQRAETLYHQAEQASERYNDARIELQDATARLKALRADVRRQQSRLDDVREQVAVAVVAQYQGQALSSTTQVLLSDDTDAFLDRLTTLSQLNDQRSQMLLEFATEAKRLELREEAAQRELDRIAKTKEKLAAEKAEIDEKAAEAKELLGRLESEQRQETASRSASRTPLVDVPASGRAGAAVRYALAQVGDAYVYGAAGPDAFDCSGLTMMAWAQAGISLPHSSSAQMGYGTPVSPSELQPGDLLFYYSPVSHVGIYIGNGQIVHAANPSTGVQVAGAFSMPLSGARRIG